MAKAKIKSSSLKTVLGPLWNVFSKDTCWEIIIDSFEDVHSANNSGIKAEKVFKTSKDLDLLVTRLLKFANKKMIEGQYSYFFKLDDYTRVNIVLPPVASKGPSIVIGKLPVKEITFDDLIKWKALTEKGVEVIKKILSSQKGFLVAGNMGSGKTTLLNTLINNLPEMHRVVTLERMPDLVIKRPLLCRLQSQTQKATEMIELIEVAERLRADFLVLSECVGPEVGPFVNMIRNNCTGIALASGESLVDAVKRVTTMTVLSSDGFSLEEANYALAQAFPYVIYQERRENGARVVSSICETSYEGGELKLKVIYKA